MKITILLTIASIILIAIDYINESLRLMPATFFLQGAILGQAINERKNKR